MYGIIWSPTPFPISVKKTSSFSSSYFTSPSLFLTFILFYTSTVWFFFRRICVSMNKINIWYSISIYFLFYHISTDKNTEIYTTCVNMSRAWNTPTNILSTIFWYVLLKMDSVCFAIPIKEIKIKWKLRRRKKNKKFVEKKLFERRKNV